MNISKVTAVYFSPTGNAEKIAVHMAKNIAEKLGAEYAAYDFTAPANREENKAFTKEDLVVFATPVYAGRVPNKVLPIIQNGFTGNDALAVPVSSWGNRNFDNALIELRNELEALGFHTVAGAGVVSSHSMSDKLAVGRPNEEDLADLAEFAGKIAEKVATMTEYPAPIGVRGDDPVGPYYTPLNMEGQPAKFLKAKPVADADLCTACGLCVKLCPMGSIDAEDPKITNGICIKCQACIRKCPRHAKHFEDEQLLSHIGYLEAHYANETKESEFFI